MNDYAFLDCVPGGKSAPSNKVKRERRGIIARWNDPRNNFERDSKVVVWSAVFITFVFSTLSALGFADSVLAAGKMPDMLSLLFGAGMVGLWLTCSTVFAIYLGCGINGGAILLCPVAALFAFVTMTDNTVPVEPLMVMRCALSIATYCYLSCSIMMRTVMLFRKE